MNASETHRMNEEAAELKKKLKIANARSEYWRGLACRGLDYEEFEGAKEGKISKVRFTGCQLDATIKDNLEKLLKLGGTPERPMSELEQDMQELIDEMEAAKKPS